LGEEIFDSITLLVKSCSYLKFHVPSPDFECRKESESVYTSSELINSLIEKLSNNDPLFTSLQWDLKIIEGPDTYTIPELCETRTNIKYCNVEHVSPCLYSLQNAEQIFQALHINTTLRSLQITGHEGFMRFNYTENISDKEIFLLSESLKHNNVLTSLDLSCNNIKNAGAICIANLLQQNTTIKKIILKRNFIQKDGLLAIAKSLMDNTVVEQIQLKNANYKEHLILLFYQLIEKKYIYAN